jgi:hypothetical protein
VSSDVGVRVPPLAHGLSTHVPGLKAGDTTAVATRPETLCRRGTEDMADPPTRVYRKDVIVSPVPIVTMSGMLDVLFRQKDWL